MHTSSSDTSPLQNGHLLGEFHAFSADSKANGPVSLMDQEAQQNLPYQRHAFREDDALIEVLPEMREGNYQMLEPTPEIVSLPTLR